MTVELGGITLTLLTQVSVREDARLVQHAVPGMSGSLIQALGRPSVVVELHGIFYGDEAAAQLQQLREAHLKHEPVDFFTEAIGEGYFTQALIAKLEVRQRAEYPNQFDFVCEVVEYVEPPEPVVTSPLGDLDAGLLNDAAAFMDDVQNAVDQVSQLTDLIANIPSFGNPTTQLNQMLTDYTSTVQDGLSVLESIRVLF